MSYLRRIAEMFAHEVGERLTEYTFVFPNRRAGLFFRRYLGQALSRPIFSPTIMTINECFASLSELRLCDPLQLLVRLYTHYKALRPEGEAIEEFLHWGKLMLADFSEVDNHLVKDVEALYAAVKDIHDIDVHFQELSEGQREAIKKFWGDFYASPQKSDNPLHQNFVRTWELLYPLYQHLTEGLLRDGLAYEGLLHRQVITHWDKIPDSAFEQHYVFVGFNALTESERQLLLRLRDRGCADFYFDYEDAYLSDPENRASLFMADNQRQFGSLYTLAPQESKSRARLTHISVDSTVGEAREVYHILSTLYPEKTLNDTDFTRTAVVLPDEQLLIPLLDCFPQSVQKINVTMGYPLRASQLYMPIAYPEKFFAPMPANGYAMIAALRGQWEVMSHAANAEAKYLLSKSLEQIEHVMMQHPDVVFSAEGVVQILRMLTMEGTIPYTGEPLDGLQVMGVLETRALDFENIIITGFNDDLYPGRGHSNSFIPYILRRGFGLPTPERQDAIFAYNFYRMLSYAERVWFITNAVADEQHSGEVSRYLYQLQWQYGMEIEQVSVMSPLSTPAKKLLAVEKDESTIELMSVARERGFSASALNSYLYCQKKFYYRYVRGIHEPEEEETITASDATIGTVVHNVMEALYEPYKQKNVTSEDIQGLLASLSEARWGELPMDAIREDCLAYHVAQTYVRQILHYDLQQAPFVYMHSEAHVRGRLHVPQVGEVLLYGYIDRIDQQANTLRVIDYKTGKANIEYRDMAHVFDRTENQDKALQTLLYCWLIKQDKPHLLPATGKIAPHIYPTRALAKPEEVETLIHQKGDTELVFDSERETQFVDGLTRLLQEIYDPSTAFVPTSKTQRCDSCAYCSLCKGK